VSTASRLTGEDRRAELEGLDIRTSWPMSTVPSAGFPQSSSCGFAWSKHFRTTHAASPCPGPPQRAGPALDLTGASRPRVRYRRSPQATPTHCLCIHVDACGRVAVRRPAVPVGRCGEGTPFASVFTEHGPLAGILVQGKLIRPQRDAPSGARLRGVRGGPPRTPTAFRHLTKRRPLRVPDRLARTGAHKGPHRQVSRRAGYPHKPIAPASRASE
jgi:hypothetical protein